MSYIDSINSLWKRPYIAKPKINKDYYENLKANLLSRYSDKSIKTIMFTSCTKGHGVSTIAINFANALANNTPFSVLLIGVSLRHPMLQRLLKAETISELSDPVILENKSLSPIKTGSGNLYLLLCGYQGTETINLLDLYHFIQLLDKMRDKFDYIILDAAPVHDSPETLILSSKIDGIILVVDSGKTRKQVAIKAKKQLEESGGKILGVVLNKCKYYIPNFIYKRL